MHGTLKLLEAELSGALTGLPANLTGVGPRRDPEKWCVQQIVGHLLLTYRTTVGTFERRIAKGRPTRATLSMSQRMWQVYVLRLGRFPAGRLAPDGVYPEAAVAECSGDELIECVQEELARLEMACDRATKIFGATPAISHVMLGPMSVDRWCTFHLVHGEHHVRQILALRKEQGC